MPFDRPTLSELRQQAATDINAALPGVDALLRYSNLGILGEVLAALANGHYGYLDWIARQSVPFTATDEALEGWAALRGVTRKPARTAKGNATFPATNGSVVPSGSQIMRRDGIAYASIADATAASGFVSVPIRAASAGAGGNAADATTMILSSGAVGVSATGAAAGAITGGADIERDDEMRSRMLAVYAAPPQGGSITDYPRWALEVPGVTRAWLQRHPMGPGTLGILFMMNGADLGTGGFPQGTDGVSTYEDRDVAATGDQLAVADALFPLQSATALVYAIAPVPNAIHLTLAGLSAASDATKTLIGDAVSRALYYDAVPGGVTNVSVIEGAIASVPAAAGFVLTGMTASAGTISPGSTGNVTSNAGALPKLAGITYT